MLTDTLIKLFDRDLNALKKEIELYNEEESMWLTPEGITNSAGNLCLHLIGNLNHFIGAGLGNSGYVRERELEFSLKDIPREDLIQQVDDASVMVSQILKQITEDDLQKDYTHQVFKEPMTTAFFLVHLSTHLSYHLGQINYHRRLLDK
ncbi:DinB family protein [Psychroserpens ponticola]|uniref:DinB family protein n=1 Tax=Psychroserpens ponticola TaxID=2932268 RepID=A0ABY7RTG4_9FLAO|nr:DinB family protein [Psychroserpens ponticola]WCO00404.1 DinB family protein [Psychroserpens ponticola]